MLVAKLVLGTLFFVVMPVGCLYGPDAPGSVKTCQSNCERQVSAGCSGTPVDFANSCESACIAYRVDYPNCVSQMNAMSACVDRKVTFGCEPNGAVSANPVAVCMHEEYTCSDCTGDPSACRN